MDVEKIIYFPGLQKRSGHMESLLSEPARRLMEQCRTYLQTHHPELGKNPQEETIFVLLLMAGAKPSDLESCKAMIDKVLRPATNS